MVKNKKQDGTAEFNTHIDILAELLDAAPGAITVRDLSGKFLYTNQKNLDLHGYEMDEFLNLNLHDLDVPESEELINERIEKIKKDGEATFIVHHFKKDGSKIPLEIFTKITQWNGKPVLLSIATDIAERIEKEDNIRKSEEKFRNLVTQMQSGLALHEIILDDNGTPIDYRFIDVNPAFERLTGLKKENVIGKTVLEVLPGTEKLWIERYGRVALTGEPIEFENYASQLDRYYSVVAYRPQKNQFAVVMQEITERRRVEEKLKDNLALLRIAGEVTKLGGWNVNLEENRSYWSDVVAKIHEMPAGFAPLLEEGINFYAPEWREKITKVFTDCAKKGIPYNERMEIITSTGRRVWIKTIGEAVRNEKGEIFKVHGAFQDISEEVEAEAELKESEERFHSLFEKAPLGYQSLDSDGNFIEVNHAWLETLGYKREEVIGKWFGDFLAPEYVQAFRERFPVFKIEGKIHSEFFMMHKDGRRKYISFDGRVAHNADGSFKKTHCILKDDTERKQAEEEIKKTSSHYQALIEKAPDGIVLISNEGKFKYVSPAARRMFGFDEFEEITADPAMYTHPDDLQRVLDEISKTTNDPDYSPTIQYRFADKFGEWKWIESTYRNLFYDPSVEAIVINFRDITEKKKAEQELRESETQYRNLANSGLALIWTSGTDKLCNYFNSTWLNFTGRTLEQELGNGWAEGVHPDDFDRCLETYVNAFDKREPFEMEYRLRHAGGEYRVILDLGNPNYNSNGEFIGYIGHCFDITERKKAEQELIESEERYKALHNASFGGIVIHDKGFILECNQGFSDITGYSYNQLIGMNGLLLIAEHARDKVFKNINEGYELPYESVGIKKNGEEYPLRLEARNIPFKGKTVRATEFRDITEQKEAEESIRESENRFRTVSEYSHNAICIIDLSGKIIWANDSLTKIGGYSKEQMYATESFIQFIAPESVEFVVGNFMKFAAGEEYEHHYSFYFIKSNGEKRLCKKHMTDYKDRSGNRFLTISMMDVTDQTKAENELRESEEKFRQLADSTTAGIFIHGGAEFQYINNSTTIHTGFSPEELYKMKFIDLVYPDDRQMVIDVWNRRNKGEQISNSYECRLNKKDGGFIWAEISANLLDFKGKKALIGTAFDITDRKLAEEKLRKSESTLQKIFNILPIGLWFADKTGKLINGNPAGVKIWGAEPKVSTEEYGVFKARRLPSMIELASDDWALAKTIKNGVTIENELLEIDAFDGKKKIILNYTAPILDDDGKVLGAIVINEDVTEKHNAEIEKEKLQDQLAQAQKMESIGRLAGGVAHDFNNMLSVIIGRTEMAMTKTDPKDSVFKELDEIKNAAERSANLTGQLLAFARKQVVTPKVISLNDELEKIFEMLKRLIGENIELSWKKGKNLWNIKIDPAQIDQIITNLCVNAKDAIKGFGKIVIETENVVVTQKDLADLPGMNPGEFVLLKVDDNGNGMDDTTIRHIFEPFFTTKELGKGTGLGLATVFGIVKQNQGFIYVESKLGEGTVFKIYLPHQIEKIAATTKEKGSENSKGSGQTILFVEDEPAILEMGELMLQSFGYTVVTASSPQEAIKKAVEHSGNIDLLITDVIMPEMNGRELSKKIISLYPEIKCLFMSGYTADIIAHQGVVDEEMNFIQKPFSIKNLGEKVKRIVGGK